MALTLQLVLQAACPLRTSVSVLSTLVRLNFIGLAVPAASTIRSWILRLGHHALHRPLDTSRPWFWLVDHTIQIGAKKLLVILGAPLHTVPFGQRALTLADLHLIALVPMDHSDGEAVERELIVAAKRTGPPELIVSDQGPDLVRGIRNYQEDRPKVTRVVDIAHVGATVLKGIWEKQPEWPALISQVEQTATKLRQSKVAELTAPRMRPKGRFMNLAVLLRFLSLVLARLDRVPADATVETHYGWLREYREPLAGWLADHAVVRSALAQIRLQGLHAGTPKELAAVWKSQGLLRAGRGREAARKLCESVREFCPREAGVRRVASTEVLESLFGKMKRLSGSQSGSGFTGLVLALGVMTGESSESEVREGLNSTPEKKVRNWIAEKLGQSVQYLRRQFLGSGKA